jgi:hypothetical protein
MLTKIVALTAAAAAALAATLAVPATASADQRCGFVRAKGVTPKMKVTKQGPIICARARAITVGIYRGRYGEQTWHCVRRRPCGHSNRYGTLPGLPGWRVWTGAGGGGAWRGRGGPCCSVPGRSEVTFTGGFPV